MKRRVQPGFTLLEMMVAITIFSLVIIVLYAGYRLGMRSWESGERMQSAVSELRIAGAFVRRHVTETLPLAISRNNAWHLWFEGEPERLVFVTPMPAYLGQGGMYEMTLAIDEQDDGASLSVSRRLLHPDADPGRPGVDDQARALVEGLESARFAFYGADENDAEASWRQHWQGKQHLPRLVRVELTSAVAGAWPEILIPLPTDAIRYQRTVAPGGPGDPGAGIGAPAPGASLLAPGLGQ